MSTRNYISEAVELHARQEEATRTRADRQREAREREWEQFHEHVYAVLGDHLTRALAVAFGAQTDDPEFAGLRWHARDVWEAPHIAREYRTERLVVQRSASGLRWWLSTEFQGVIIRGHVDLPNGWRPDEQTKHLPEPTLALRVGELDAGENIEYAEFRDLASFGGAVQRLRERELARRAAELEERRRIRKIERENGPLSVRIRHWLNLD